jgi:c-di-GMP-binding flagellar brake protein YcgR
MSLTGMRLVLTEPVKAGALLSVKYDTVAGYLATRRFDVDTIHTRVVWCRKRKGSTTVEAGVAYTDSDEVMARSWVKYILKQLGFDVHGIVERRKEVRVRAVIAVCAAPLLYDADETAATIVNLGAGGCLIDTPTYMRHTTKVTLEIGPLAGYKPFKAIGKVLQCAKVPDTGRWSMRVQFDDMDPSDVDALGRYIAHLLKETQ